MVNDFASRELQRPERAVEDVTAHVAERAGSELGPVPPPERVQPAVVVAVARRPEPLVPVKSFGHRFALRPLLVPAEVARHQAVRLGHVADRAGPDVLAQPAVALARVPLVAHRRVNLVLPRFGRERARLVDAPRQRLLAEHTLARANGADRGRRVVVVRGGDQHRVDVLRVLVVHRAVVVVHRRVFDLVAELLDRLRDLLVVHVAERDEALARRGAGVAAALPAAPDDRDPELLVRRACRKNRRRGVASGDRGGLFEERAARGLAGHDDTCGRG